MNILATLHKASGRHRGMGRLLSFVVIFIVLAFGGAGNASFSFVPEAAQASEDDAVFLHLKQGRFDPLQDLPVLASSLSYTLQEASQAGLYIVQFAGPVTEEHIAALTAADAKVGGYVPDYAFVVSLDRGAKAAVERLSDVRWLGPYQPGYKLAPDAPFAGERSYHIYVAPWIEGTTALQALDTVAGTHLRGAGQHFSVVLSESQLTDMARLPEVLWVEPYYLRRTFNDVGGGDIMGGTTAWSQGYSGSGVTIAAADTGLDTGDPGNIHGDFAGRVTNISSWPVVYANYGLGCETANTGADDGGSDVDSGHGTHVTGSIAGNGARSGGQLKGLGYDTTITFQALEQYTTWTNSPVPCPEGEGYYLTGIPDDMRTLLKEAYNWGTRVHSNSWGGGDAGEYDTMASQFDSFLYIYGDMNIVVAAGNWGKDADGNGYVDEGSVFSPATAKNVVSVGASENERNTGGYQYTWGQAWPMDYPADPTSSDMVSNSRGHMAAFSGRGPTADGRIKPDVVAPGTNILSTRSSVSGGNGWGPYDDYYMYMGGTSMATPLVSGAAALVREFYVSSEDHANPSAALIKATLINSAVDMDGYGNANYEAGQPIPNHHEGWGQVDVGHATTPGERQFVDSLTGLSTNDAFSYNYHVQADAPFKVTLVWTDYPGSPMAGKTLVNDLNLRVTAPDGNIYWGNYFSGGWSQVGGGGDTVNNVENVYVSAPEAGEWTVEVRGYNVPQGPQPFALVVDGNLTQDEPLSVTDVRPDHAPNNQVASLTIEGSGFTGASQAHLVRASDSLSMTVTSVHTETDIISATVDLTGATPGWWDVRVSNAEISATLPAAFQVIDGSLPNLYVSKTVETPRIDPATLLTYTITLENRGYVSATKVVFTDTLPAGVIFMGLSPSCAEDPVVLPGRKITCAVASGTIEPGVSLQHALVVSVTMDADGQQIVNHVVVDSANTDADSTDNTAYVSVLVGTTEVYLPLVVKEEESGEVPGAPVLSAIDNQEYDGNYLLSWTAGDGGMPTVYDVEENGTVILTDYTGTSYTVSGRLEGTYTYRVRGKNAYGTGPWSAGQSTEVRAAAENPILNGDFESGSDGSWTEISSHNFDLIVDDFGANPLKPHSGNWAVWLGGKTSEVSSISQAVTIPADQTTLSFWYQIGSQDSCGNDFGYLKVDDTVIQIFDLCVSENTSGWVEFTTDLSAYATQMVVIDIRAELDDRSGTNSNFFIDDVALE